MHIVIGVLSAVAGLIWAYVALRRTGFDPNSLNPFLWIRRSHWQKLYAEKPIFRLTDPMDVAALLILGMAKCDGEISAEQKKQILAVFENEFHLTANEAADLLLASSHLMRDEIYLVDNLARILEKSRSKFTASQVESLLSLVAKIGAVDGPLNGEQNKLIAATQSQLTQAAQPQGQWH